ncbi:MAG TPA: heme-binding protein [Pseudolabrys sp.]|jgi:glc operon protein GlcG
MLRITSSALGLCAAILISTAAFAQVPANPNNPNENVPEKLTYTPYGETIKLDQAKKIADVALAEATKRNWPMCIAIVGPTGDLVYFEKMDDCQYASVTISQGKAKSAARYRRPTIVFERLMGNSPFNSYLPTLGDAFVGSRGGNPIVVNGKIIGAIGVSGGTGSQDDTISQAGAHSVK